MNIERRVTVTGELRVVRSDGKMKLAGYSARFNTLSENLGWFREQIKPGFFADAVGRDDVRALFNHDPNLVLGRSSAGTMTFEEDGTGLMMTAEPPDVEWTRALALSIERRDVTGQSFSFTTLEDAWGEDVDGNLIRTLVKVGRLYDLGPVTFPAYPDTDVQMRDVSAEAIERAKQMLGGRSVDFARRRLGLTAV